VFSPTRLPTHSTRPRSTMAHPMKATLAMPMRRGWWMFKISEIRLYLAKETGWCAPVRIRLSMDATLPLPSPLMCLVHTTICERLFSITGGVDDIDLLSIVI
jgi:hypothetical protein